MASFALEMAKYALGYANYTPNWKVALYYNGFDPVTDLANAEMTGTRTSLVTMIDSVGNPGYLENSTGFYVGPATSGVAGGWFIVNDVETDVAWVGTFASPLTLSTGDYVNFDAGTLLVRIA